MTKGKMKTILTHIIRNKMREQFSSLKVHFILRHDIFQFTVLSNCIPSREHIFY